MNRIINYKIEVRGLPHGMSPLPEYTCTPYELIVELIDAYSRECAKYGKPIVGIPTKSDMEKLQCEVDQSQPYIYIDLPVGIRGSETTGCWYAGTDLTKIPTSEYRGLCTIFMDLDYQLFEESSNEQ
jgi:hypothetical protein